jgi:hypothetical protein
MLLTETLNGGIGSRLRDDRIQEAPCSETGHNPKQIKFAAGGVTICLLATYVFLYVFRVVAAATALLFSGRRVGT